mmetsp:Transcript_6232/g.19641  ORF Transcript_6232/g.19641 Transcript_6232/m.19641 type:complete len:89 (+) Transcript_6232:367-633(+)
MTTSSVPSALRLKAYEFSAAFIEQEAHVDSLSIDLKKCPVDNSLLRPPSTSDYCTYDTPSLEAFTDTNPNVQLTQCPKRASVLTTGKI